MSANIYRFNASTTSKEGFKLTEAYNLYKSGDKEKSVHELKGFFGQFLFGGQDRHGNMTQWTTERTGLP